MGAAFIWELVVKVRLERMDEISFSPCLAASPCRTYDYDADDLSLACLFDTAAGHLW